MTFHYNIILFQEILSSNFLILENTHIYSKELFFRNTREDGLIVNTYLFVSCELYDFGTYVIHQGFLAFVYRFEKFAVHFQHC